MRLPWVYRLVAAVLCVVAVLVVCTHVSRRRFCGAWVADDLPPDLAAATERIDALRAREGLNTADRPYIVLVLWANGRALQQVRSQVYERDSRGTWRVVRRGEAELSFEGSAAVDLALQAGGEHLAVRSRGPDGTVRIMTYRRAGSGADRPRPMGR